ncbi:MAG TPA: molybdenum cofactor guanylyltransferase [Acidobacteriota bacterium]|nr:molybdenum cofactor guanylyltransferase [Burkholderiales bacterium]HYA30292.1 molybdenum cofactor guanylyltransferase [Acidobacteriota bacterium]
MMQRDSAGNTSAIILAGGKSLRMGTPKYLLPFAGEPLITHIVRRLQNLFADVVVVAAADQSLPSMPARVVRDELPHQGPVGGILYGLRAAAQEIAFVTACDAPFLNLTLIQSLLSALGAADVAVPFWQDRLQPLHAVYRSTVKPLLEQQLSDGRLRPTFLYERVTTRIVSEAELLQIDPEGLSFININTPEEYHRALRRWSSLP